MNLIKVQGKNKAHNVLMYALSTCAWCKLTKKFLKDNNVEYEYVDVDHCTGEEIKSIHKNVSKLGGRISYPIVIIDNTKLINGFYEEKLKEALKI